MFLGFFYGSIVWTVWRQKHRSLANRSLKRSQSLGGAVLMTDLQVQVSRPKVQIKIDFPSEPTPPPPRQQQQFEEQHWYH